ncbi:MAG: TetR/AcrR family transcriptional regulator [Tannerellaceae bacterium]|nr:TetR/AcrR family transcriptional regulator [Tannerellaceae bacterium]
MANPSSELSSEEFILKCAFSLFLLASNYEKVTIRDFYKVYGVSSGAIYNYFRNKNELLIKMIDVYIFKVQSTENKFKLPETFTFLDFLIFI